MTLGSQFGSLRLARALGRAGPLPRHEPTPGEARLRTYLRCHGFITVDGFGRTLNLAEHARPSTQATPRHDLKMLSMCLSVLAVQSHFSIKVWQWYPVEVL